MGIMIEDGKGSGTNAEVSPDNRLRVHAASASITNHVTLEPELQTVFTAIGTAAEIVGVAPVLFIQNNDPSLLLVLDRITIQTPNIAGLPTVNKFFSLSFGRTFTSGGADIIPVNQNRTATRVANGIFKTGTPALVLGGTATESHRWYAQTAGTNFELIVLRANDIVLGRSNSLEISFTSNAASANIAFALVKFFYATIDHMA